MPLSQAEDFLAECEALYTLLRPLDAAVFAHATDFKGWTINDVLVHLHVWNGMADMALTDPNGFEALAAEIWPELQAKGFRAFEDQRVRERGPDLLDLWMTRARDMAQRWSSVDPKHRLPWVGPSMSARSSMTARQMETWAHGYEVFDRLGRIRPETDRIQNIVRLGVNTFGWSHKVHGLPVPAAMPLLELTAPSGAVWTFGDAKVGAVRGPAADFAAVVTQTRALADTDLVVLGEVAKVWLAHAQCFAGPPVTPPGPGSRKRHPARAFT